MEATRRQSGGEIRAGSALILTVVLTVLLALIGVLFVMAARLDEMGTSSIADERELSAAVDSVVGQISKVMVDDLYGTDRTRKLVDLARKERRHERGYVLPLYDWQDAHMEYARVCHTRRRKSELRKLGFA